MTVMTLLKYLIGNRQAILDIAGSRQSLWIGLLFVLSAGLAREYDGADLWHEPWHLVLPLGASLLTSFLLFCLVYAIGCRRGCPGGRFWKLYCSFLSLYWMTAPLAWLYAIPVERFLSTADATTANLWLLALVALWRVSLMTRVIAVLFQAGAWASFFVVMFFADTVALVLLYLTPLPVFNVMGGIRLSPSERIIQGTAILVGLAGVTSWPIWLIGMSIVGFPRRSDWTPAVEGPSAGKIGPSLWGLACLSLAVWIIVLPRTQSEQQLKWLVERDLRAGRLERAVRLLSAHERADFPPHWDPPPQLGYGEESPSIVDIMEMVVAADARPWIREIFAAKYLNHLRGTTFSYHGPARLGELTDDELDRVLTALENLPGVPAFVVEERDTFEMLQRQNHRKDLRDRIRVLFAQVGLEPPKDIEYTRPLDGAAPGSKDPAAEEESDPNADSQ
ncbi:MAG: hypothetical protein ACM3U2_07180 [Deltaproteobacteria bacterium]